MAISQKDKKTDYTVSNLFGIARGKFKKSAQQIKDEIRAELHDL